MRRMPLSFKLLGVLAAILSVNVSYASCSTCRGPKPLVSGAAPPIIEPQPISVMRDNYFDDQEPVVAVKPVKTRSIVSHPRHHKKSSAVRHSKVVSLERPKYTMHKRKMVMNRNVKPRVLKPIGRFGNIVAGSDINIILRNSPITRVVVMSCDNQGRPLVGYRVQRGTLYLQDITNPKTCRVGPRPLQVLVETNGVNSLELYDRSSIYAPDYQSRQMYVQSFTAGPIMLNGKMNVYRIEQYGSSMIVVDDLRRRELDIISRGPGLVKVGGSVDSLHIRALANAHIDAKFLRAEDAWVQSTGASEVAVTVNNALDGYATMHSWIYYYKTPQFLTPMDFEHANVIQMAYWD